MRLRWHEESARLYALNNRPFIVIEHYPEARGTTFLIGNMRISVAVGVFSRRTWDYWKELRGDKRTISTRHFWLCWMPR